MSQRVSKVERVTETVTPWLSLLGIIGFLCAIVLAACPGCQPPLYAAISLKVAYAEKTPADASVVIDEQYIGPLGYVAAHGVRLRLGEHRVSVTKAGYFPYDRVIVAGDHDLKLDVVLEPIPD
jgi:hypothetical protein